MTCTRIVLLGAEKKELDAHSNFQRTNELRSDLLALGLSIVGVSKVANTRKSQLFMVENVSDLSPLLKLAEKYEQLSVLVMDDKRNAEALSIKNMGKTKELGVLSQVSKENVVGKKFYLTFMEDGKEYFYITKKGVICDQRTSTGNSITNRTST
jgi:hypothetical protein